MDAGQVQVAVRLPAAVRVRPGSAVLTLAARRVASDETLEGRFVLEKLDTALASAELQAALRPGVRIEVFRIAESDLARLDSLQRWIRDWENEDPDDTQGSLTINVAGCRVGALAAGPVSASTYLRIDAAEDFILLTEDVDLRTVEGLLGGSGAGELVSCEPVAKAGGEAVSGALADQ